MTIKLKSPKEFGKLVKDRREALGYVNQVQVAAKLAVTESCVRNWEKGISTPSYARLAELMELLQIEPYELGNQDLDL